MPGASASSSSTSEPFRWPFAEALAEALAGRLAGALAGQGLDQPLHRRGLGGVLDREPAPLLLEPDRLLDEVAGDLLDVAADIADLGELGRLDLDEGRVGELGQPAADLGLAAAGRPDHQDVLGSHFLAKAVLEPLPPPAVAQRHRDRALGLGLADDMLVEGGDHRLGGETVVHFCPVCPCMLSCGVDGAGRAGIKRRAVARSPVIPAKAGTSGSRSRPQSFSS